MINKLSEIDGQVGHGSQVGCSVSAYYVCVMLYACVRVVLNLMFCKCTPFDWAQLNPL